jgi:hypothetical protein
VRGWRIKPFIGLEPSRGRTVNMVENVVLTEKTVGGVDLSNIEALLAEASINYLCPSEAYQLGFNDGQRQIFDSMQSNLMAGMIPAAETFYQMLLNVVSKEDILQHRIGLDYTTGTPVTLTVIAEKHDDKLMDIMRMASSLELYLFKERRLECSFWTITDRSLDQWLVDNDFPYYKKGL